MPNLIGLGIWTADFLRNVADRLWPADDMPAYLRVKRDIEAYTRRLKTYAREHGGALTLSQASVSVRNGRYGRVSLPVTSPAARRLA